MYVLLRELQSDTKSKLLADIFFSIFSFQSLVLKEIVKNTIFSYLDPITRRIICTLTRRTFFSLYFFGAWVPPTIFWIINSEN